MKKLLTLLLASMLVLNTNAQDKKKIALLQPRAVVSTTAVDPIEQGRISCNKQMVTLPELLVNELTYFDEESSRELPEHGY